MIWVSILVVALLVAVNAVFVAAEIALVSLRESQVRALAERSTRGNRVAALVHEPNRFLAAVQLGVTTTAVLVSAFGEATLGDPVGRLYVHLGLSPHAANIAGFVTVVVVIAYVTILFGELVPKRLALQHAEGAAVGLGAPLDRFSRLSRPFIWFLSKSTDLFVRMFGGDPRVGREAITEEELRDMVSAHESLTGDERRLIEEVFSAGERQLREVIVPRTEVEFLDESMPVSRAAKLAQATPYSRFPVVRGSQDDVVGFVHVKDLLQPTATARRGMRVGDLAREVAQFPGSKKLLATLSEMRRGGHHLAVVVDEYGGTAGIVTLEDLIEELIGDIRDEYDVGPEEARKLSGGDVDVDGLLNLEDFEEVTGVPLPEGPYETVAGYVMAVLGRLPRQGDAVEANGCRLKVTKMDGRRVERLLVTKLAPAGEQAAQEGGEAE